MSAAARDLDRKLVDVRCCHHAARATYCTGHCDGNRLTGLEVRARSQGGLIAIRLDAALLATTRLSQVYAYIVGHSAVHGLIESHRQQRGW